MKNQDKDKLCIWKEMIDEGRDPHKRLSPLCYNCRGYDDICVEYRASNPTSIRGISKNPYELLWDNDIEIKEVFGDNFPVLR